MREEHLSGVFAIELECFSQPWSLAALQETFRQSYTYFFVAVDKKMSSVAGYIGFYVAAEQGFVLNIAVLPKYRRKGIARRLLGIAVDLAKDKNVESLSLEVRASNVPAITLYGSLGFEKVGVRRFYYSQPEEDAVVMTRFFRESL